VAVPDALELDELKEGFSGQIHTPEQRSYEEARSIFNSMIERRPAVIAQCESADDIASALAFARQSELEVSVRGGGHSVSGACLTDGGLVIDLRRMNRVTVDPDARTATAQGGATWSDFDRACQPHNLVATGGRVSSTGVAGLTLGGGSGWVERKFGMACDNLLSVELLTADGRTVTASEDENPELFWALHGAGGNFGIATQLTFRLHQLPAFTAALLIWPPDAGREVTRTYRDFMADAPDELGGGVVYLTGPPEEFVPEKLQNELACAVLITHCGPEDEARELMAPVLELEPEGQMIAEMPYAELQCMIDDPPGYRNYWSAEYLTEFPDQAVDLFCARAHDMVIPSPSQHIFFPQGGAIARNDNGDSPLATRQAPWATHPLGLWEDPADDQRAISWAKQLNADMKPWAIGAVYLNFIGDEGEERIVAGYGRENYERLAAVKAEYDPDNVFHLHHPIRPLTTA
jgi:FAD/FMN-containing dehydrogenase